MIVTEEINRLEKRREEIIEQVMKGSLTAKAEQALKNEYNTLGKLVAMAYDRFARAVATCQ
jgi:hypothetical protein